MKITRLLAALFVFASALPVSAAQLRVLIIGDTNDRSIGKSVVTDIANFEQFMRDVSQRTGLRLDMRIIKGNEVKARVITDAVNKLTAAGDDTVVFYYSGHGFRTQKVQTRWPLLYIPDAGTKGVDFQWVIDTLNAKNPRMLLAISDSCNSFIDLPPNAVNSRAMRVDSDAAWRKLFVEFAGRIYASGSIVGQFSFGQDATGGAFTSRFLSIVRSEVKNDGANWENIMKLATRKIPINNPQQKSQDPQYELVLAAATQTPQAEVTAPPVQAEEATATEQNDQCQALAEFQAALVTVKDSMPAKLDFKSQQSELQSYREFVAALVQAGGDKQMVTLVKNMDQGLKARNWSRFRSAVWAYERRVTRIQQENCSN